MATRPKAQPRANTYRVRVEVPAKADATVVRALQSVGEALPGAQIEKVVGAPPNTYSVTIHVVPDKEQS